MRHAVGGAHGHAVDVVGHFHHRRAEAEVADVGSHRPRELVEPADHPMGHERSGVAG